MTSAAGTCYTEHLPMPIDLASLFGFPLGEPPHDDVEAAATLLVRYGREAPLTADDTASFMQLVANPRAVRKRARELANAVEP